MTRWWMSAALTALWLGQVTATQAQYLPCPPPSAPPPEPVPFCLSEPPTPGPLPPQTAPPGPANDLGLPDNVPGAFMDCPQREETHWFSSLGASGLQRQGLGHVPLVYLDPGTGTDSGVTPLVNKVTSIQDVHDVHPHLDFGPRGTLGYLWGNQSVELTGFYIPEDKTRRITSNPGSLDVFFTNAPIGFEGDNGLFLQSDRIRTSFTTALADSELNYRYWNKAIVEAELILGARYIDLQEKLRIFTDDEGLTTQDVFGNPDPTRQATYQVRTHNHILAPQIGFESTYPLCSWLSCSLEAKGGFGADYYEITNSLKRGDGFNGFDLHEHNTTWCHLYELGFFLDFHILERLRLRTGYEALWVLHVPEAVQQLNFDLSQQLTDIKENGSIFYHGPMIELQFLF
jgi:Putative beta barrel porin-7 (BBP7)